MTSSITLHLFGRFDVAAFRAFAESRARLLRIDMTTERMEGHEIVFLLRGLMPLLACSSWPA